MEPHSVYVNELLGYFKHDHLPGHLHKIVAPFDELAHEMANQLESRQLERGLEKLVEAKDCMVRSALSK